MSNEFMREERYIVFKVSDLGNSLKGDEIRRLAREYAEQRRLKGKKPLECVVVEKDWPEYEPTWRAIEARVTGAQPAPNAVAYLDIGAGGYRDIGTDLTDDAIAAIHMLGIIRKYGVDGYVPAQPAPSVPTALLVAVADLVAQMEIVSRVGFVDTPNDKDSCAAFCVAEGTWLELMSCVEALTAALAAPEAKP